MENTGFLIPETLLRFYLVSNKDKKIIFLSKSMMNFFFILGEKYFNLSVYYANNLIVLDDKTKCDFITLRSLTSKKFIVSEGLIVGISDTSFITCKHTYNNDIIFRGYFSCVFLGNSTNSTN